VIGANGKPRDVIRFANRAGLGAGCASPIEADRPPILGGHAADGAAAR
jgi:hypothetical protein